MEGRSQFLQVFTTSSWLTYYFHKTVFLMAVNMLLCIRQHNRMHKVKITNSSLDIRKKLTSVPRPSYSSCRRPMPLLPQQMPALLLAPTPPKPYLSHAYNWRFYMQLTSFLKHPVNDCLLGTFSVFVQKTGTQNTLLHRLQSRATYRKAVR